MNCKHCLNRSGDQLYHDFACELDDSMQIDLAKQIADLAPDQCCLCGGETLLNKNIFEIINIISSAGVMVNMVTNGLLITDSVAKKLKNCGISHVQVSIDGLGYQHDLFRNKKGAFSKSIKALKILKDNQMDIMVSCCPNKMNVGSIEAYVEYMYKVVGVTCIRMMPLLPIGRAQTECSHLFLSSAESFEFVQKLIKLRDKYPDLTLEWGDPLEHLYLVLFNRRKYPIIMSIGSTGDLTVTPYIPIILGNIKEKKLKTIWENGYNKIWSNKQVVDIIKQVITIYDLSQFNETFYLDEKLWINI